MPTSTYDRGNHIILEVSKDARSSPRHFRWIRSNNVHRMSLMWVGIVLAEDIVTLCLAEIS